MVHNHVIVQVSVAFEPFPHVLQLKIGLYGLEPCDSLSFRGV